MPCVLQAVPVMFITVDSTSECPCANERAGIWLPGISTLRCGRDPGCPADNSCAEHFVNVTDILPFRSTSGVWENAEESS